MDKRIKELAEQAGVSITTLGATYTYGKLPEILERFAELVRQDERKACADLVFEMAQLPKYEKVWLPLHHAQSAIRARGNHEQD